MVKFRQASGTVGARGRCTTMCPLVLSLALVALASVAMAQRSPLQLEVRPLFGTTVPPYGCLPLKITVQNEGPPVEATLVVSPSRFRGERVHLFPLTLPTGSRKEIVALPFIMPDTMRVSVGLKGVRGVSEQTIPVFANPNARLVVGVGDEIGGLEWLKHLKPKSPTPPPRGPVAMPLPPGSPAPIILPIEWVWAYCRPEDLPDKAGALTGVSVIVLGTGAERLSMAQWQAIRRWVMMGGVLVVPGGSAAIYLRHVMLAPLLPIQNWRTVKHSSWRELARWVQVEPPQEPAFITIGDLAPGAQLFAGTHRLPLVAAKPYGLGAVVYLAFNPWDRPFRGWKGLPNLWRKSVALSVTDTTLLWSSCFMNPDDRLPHIPFWLELPSAANLAVVLFAYFALVVPVSYAFLRRKRALDWHWLIAPVIAIVYVFIIGQATFGLSKLGNQNLVRGLVIVAAGEREAYLLANATLFIQRAGNYLLDFGNAEGVFTWVSDYGGFTGGASLETQDGATVSTALRVPNLSFRQFDFVKPITLQGKVDVDVKREGDRLQVTVTNRLPFALKEVECWLEGYIQLPKPPWASGFGSGLRAPKISTTQLPNLSPQETKVVNLTVKNPPARPDHPLWLVVKGEIEGMDIAPNLNTPSQRKSYVRLCVVRAVRW